MRKAGAADQSEKQTYGEEEVALRRLRVKRHAGRVDLRDLGIALLRALQRCLVVGADAAVRVVGDGQVELELAELRLVGGEGLGLAGREHGRQCVALPLERRDLRVRL